MHAISSLRGAFVAPGASNRFFLDLPCRHGEGPMVGPHVLPGGWLKRDEMEVRHALVTYLRAEAVDHDFRATLIQNMAHHSEWKAVLER